MAIQTYTPPSITVREVSGGNFSSSIIDNTDVCLIGLAQGYQTKSVPLLLAGTGPFTIDPNLDPDATVSAVTQVINSNFPVAPYVVTTDYTISGNTLTRVAAGGIGNDTTTSGSTNSSTTTITVASTTGFATSGVITINAEQIAYTGTTPTTFTGCVRGFNGTTAATHSTASVVTDNVLVTVDFQYVPGNYFEPTRFFDLASVKEAYGNPYAADNKTIGSHLSFAAMMAFENGAASVVCMPLAKRATADDPNTALSLAVTADVGNSAVWADTLYILRDSPEVNIIVPIVGQSFNAGAVTDQNVLDVLKACQDHIQYMRTINQYVLLFCGEDSTFDVADATALTLRSHASGSSGLRSRYSGATAEYINFISPAKFKKTAGDGSDILIGGQFVAAAYAGLASSTRVSESLTRKQVGGIKDVTDARTTLDKNNDANAGLTVIENDRGRIRVRHSITVSNESTAKREPSVIRSKAAVIESVVATLDEQVVGQTFTKVPATEVVRSLTSTVLVNLRDRGVINGFSDVAVRVTNNDPTTIEVRFSILPAFPVNYIDIVLSVDSGVSEQI